MNLTRGCARARVGVSAAHALQHMHSTANLLDQTRSKLQREREQNKGAKGLLGAMGEEDDEDDEDDRLKRKQTSAMLPLLFFSLLRCTPGIDISPHADN
eukprot:3050206-Rhodomonas_salina.1